MKVEYSCHFSHLHVKKFIEYSKKAVVNYVRSAVQRTESILEKLGITGASLKDGPMGHRERLPIRAITIFLKIWGPSV